MESKLKLKVYSGMYWKLIEVSSTHGVGFIISIILARILNPSDFGLIGMISIFFAYTNILVDSGYSQALIQKQDRSESDFSSIFFFNLFISIICYAIIYIASPLISNFFKILQLTDILRVYGLNLIIQSLNIVQQTRLQIFIDFKKLTFVSFLSTVLGGIAGVIMAYCGFGVWALVSQVLIASIVRTFTIWKISGWQPSLLISVNSIKNMFGYGSKLLISGIYATTVQYLYNILIGKYYSATSLGYYTRAYQIPELVSNTAGNVVNSVSFPLLSSIQNQHEKLIPVYRRIVSATAFFVFPIMTLFCILAEPFVYTILTEKWLPIVPLIYWLTISRMFSPISTINLTLLKSIGESGLCLKIDLLKLPIIVINMIITLPLGIKAVSIGLAITSLIFYIINALFSGGKIGFSIIEQFKDLKKIFGSVIIMIFVTTLTINNIDTMTAKLLLGFPIGIITYCLSAYFLNIEEFYESMNIIKKFIKK